MMPSAVVSQPRIEVRNLRKSFRREGGKTVTPVDDVTLTVAENELVVLLGPSGCGKTTLLRCVAGLERPESGEILIDGKLVFSSDKAVFVPPDRRTLSMVYQSFALWPHMTVSQNIAYPLVSRRTPRSEIASRVARVIELVGISGLEQQYPGRISGGQQQRVALARALVAGSNVVLFDEPLSNVDAQVRAHLRLELKRMREQLGFSGLYVTHDQSEAMELGHRVAVLQSGRIAALGAPAEIYEAPPSEYVANFVGAANIFSGTVRSVDADGIRVATGFGQHLATSAAGAPALQPGQAVKLMVRPERLRLGPEGSEPGTVRVTVETVMFSGAHTEVVVRHDRELLRVWSHGDPQASTYAPGQPLGLIMPPRLHIVETA